MSDLLLYAPRHKELFWYVGDSPYAGVQLPTQARVLDVGAGQGPHPGADVVLDKFIDDDSERPAKQPLARQKRLSSLDGAEFIMPMSIVCGDVVDIPFPDKSFDFIICNNILEHVEDVRQAFAEISRVGKAGFIDVPRMASEYLFPQGAMHKWVFSEGERGLTAHRIGFESPWKDILHYAVSISQPVATAWNESHSFFHVVHLWQDNVSVEIGADARATFKTCDVFRDMRDI